MPIPPQKEATCQEIARLGKGPPASSSTSYGLSVLRWMWLLPPSPCPCSEKPQQKQCPCSTCDPNSHLDLKAWVPQFLQPHTSTTKMLWILLSQNRLFYYKRAPGFGLGLRLAQSIKHLPCKYKDTNSNPHNPHKSGHASTHLYPQSSYTETGGKHGRILRSPYAI